RTFARVATGLQSGDIVFFVSGTAGLDTNHTGFVIRRGDQLLLRSASRRQRSVTDQPLDDYIRRHPMSGLFINRPR
ncbi:MAG: N-acetylmuramoyl-L-alanine amidase-like domain-containing protein, partial [Blastocatellia bacterium]